MLSSPRGAPGLFPKSKSVGGGSGESLLLHPSPSGSPAALDSSNTAFGPLTAGIDLSFVLSVAPNFRRSAPAIGASSLIPRFTAFTHRTGARGLVAEAWLHLDHQFNLL